MATKEITHLGTYVVPKVNLLPPEIGEKKAQQRAFVAMGATVLAALGAVGFLYMAQASRVAAAQEEVAAAKAQNQRLAAEQEKLAYVNAIYAEVDANEVLLTQAVDKRIFWSGNLHDVALQIPEGVWLRQMEIKQVVDGEPTDPSGEVLPQYNLGEVTFKGRAFSHDDIAAWLGASAKIKGYANSFYSKSEVVLPTPEERALGDRSYVEFDATADISPAAVQPARKAVTKK